MLDFAALRKRSCGAWSELPCAYFEGKNREMKAKKERERIIPKDKFKEFVEFQRRWVEGESRR